MKKKIEKRDKILKIVKEILDFNKRIRKQQGLGLKILTPNQILSRLPITLAKLKQETILRNLKMKLGKFCILCTDQKTYKATL